MPISRRALLQHLAAGAALTAAARSVGADETRAPIRLNRNENAYGPSEKVVAAIREAVTSASRYADQESAALRRKIAALHRVTPERVLLGCGSSEILRMAVDAFLGSGKKLIAATPTFDAIAQYARRVGADVTAVPLTPDYAHDLDAMLARCDAATGLVYICNPNNPTGTLTSRRDLESFLRRIPTNTYVVIDEAYHHYVAPSSDYASFIDRPLEHSIDEDGRVIVTRTYSKIYALAGLRVGYAICTSRTARLLAVHELSDGLNVVAAGAAVTALDDTVHVRASARRNVDDRQEFLNQANARMLRTIDSQANFVMIRVGRRSDDIVEHFRQNDVLIGPVFPAFDRGPQHGGRLAVEDHHIRVSLGTAAEMRTFWRVWDLMPVHTMTM